MFDFAVVERKKRAANLIFIFFRLVKHSLEKCDSMKWNQLDRTAINSSSRFVSTILIGRESLGKEIRQ